MRKKNTYFQFKKFRIEQAQTAMKVSTEACILGAYCTAEAPKNILDIGTGTGLLSLMLAQRFPAANITAIEIEKNAFKQASENIQASFFGERLEVLHQSVQDFAKYSSRKYDLIVSNPPFYENHLVSGATEQDIALHQQTLTLAELLEAVCMLLSVFGVFWLILPPFQMQQFITIAEQKSLFLQQELSVYHSEKHPVFRKIACFSSQKPVILLQETLYIKNADETYTSLFSQLLKDFYLAF
jgi:tRNA1Val (adenine37-N6)-methyltransferase